MSNEIPLDELYERVALYDLVDSGPSTDDLTTAPTLDQWTAVQDIWGEIMLFGSVRNHPRLGSRSIHTSMLFGLDVQAGWARTYRRWYRVGAQHPGRGQEAFRLPSLITLTDLQDVQAILAAQARATRALVAAARKQ